MGNQSGGASRAPGARAALAAMVVVLVAVGGCGYGLVGVSSKLPTHLQRLCVTPFVNQTERAELDQRLAEALTQEWVKRGRFQLVATPEQADAVLSGTIVTVVSAPVQFDPQGRVTEYQLTLIADVQLIDRSGEKPVTIWHDKRFSRSVTYVVTIDATNYFDRETEATERLSRDFARGLVVTILEGF